jgi:glycolate oxidase iron-sulfur subunit
MKTELPIELTSTPSGATAERVLRSCVHCGMCNATCPTYQLTGDELDGPRGRIYLIKQALEGKPVSRITEQHLDRCLGCRACETTCPSGVEYHKLYDIGREAMKQRIRRRWLDRLIRWGIRSVVPFPARLRLAVVLARAFQPVLPKHWRAKLVESQRQAAPVISAHGRRMLLLSGCVQSVLASRFNAATVRVFERLGISLVEAPAAQCCGALSFHLDDPDMARALARRNIDAWWPHMERGAEAIIVNATGCAVFLREYGELLSNDAEYATKAERIAALVRDPVEILVHDLPPVLRKPQQRRIAVHEPCTLQNGLRLNGRIATLLSRLGYEPQPVRDAHLCCGSAGAYSLLQPEISISLRDAKLQALTEHAPEAVYTANIGCWMHLAEAAQVPVRHWIEAVDEVARPAPATQT